MSEQLGSGEIRVEVDDAGAVAALHRIEAEFEKTMADIDRQSADIKIEGDLSVLKKDLAEAKALVKAAEEDMAKSHDDASKKRAKSDAEAARARAKALEQEVRAVEDSVKARKRENSELNLSEKRIVAVAKREEQRAKVLDAQERKRSTAAKAAQRDIERTQRMQERADAMAERARTKAERDSQRAEAARQREIAQIPKMRREYAELAQSIDRLNNSRRKVKRDERAKMVVDLKITEAVAKMAVLKKTLERVGSPVDIDVDIHPGRDFGLMMRRTIGDGMRSGGVRTAMRDAGTLAGLAFSGGVAGVMRRNLNPKRLLGGVSNVFSRLGHGLSNLSDMTVRLGPFTATIKQAFIGLSLLGPIIVDIIGGLGALVGVAASAAGGLGALAVAAGAGFIPAALGMVLALKPVKDQFKQAMAASKAYHDAIAKGNTDLAKKKLQEMNHVLGNVDDRTRAAFKSAGNLSKEWANATAPTRAAAFKTIGDALHFAHTNMKTLSEGTNQFAKATSGGLRNFMKNLDMGALKQNMGNVSRAMNPLLTGVGHLTNYLLRVGAIAGKSLAPMARQFSSWAKNLKPSQKGIQDMIASLKSVGRFAMSAGRMLKTFFFGGASAGRNFLDTMTRAMDRWNEGFKTPEGQKSLATFFQNSVDGVQSLYAALAPVGREFVKWSALLAPFARIFFQAAAGVAEFVSGVLEMTALKGPVSALVATLGTLWAIGKISGATRALIGFTQALRGVAGAQAAVTASSGAAAGIGAATSGLGAGLAARQANLIRGAAAVEQTTQKVTRLTRVASVGKSAMTGLGAAVTGIASPIAGLGVVTVAAAAGLYVWANREREWQKQTKISVAAGQQFKQLVSALGDGNIEVASSTIQLTSATRGYHSVLKQSRSEQAQLNKLVNDGKKGTSEYKTLLDQHKDTLLQVRDATLQNYVAAQNRQRLRKQEIKAIKDTQAAATTELKSAIAARNDLGKNNVAEDFNRQAEAAKKAGMSVRDYINSHAQFGHAKEKLLDYADAVDRTKQAWDDSQRAERQAMLQTLNLGRALNGLVPMGAAAAKVFQTLTRLGGKNLASKISLKFEAPKDAARVAEQATRALKSGISPKITMKIVADAKNANDAVRRLKNITVPDKLVHIIEKGGKGAIHTLEDLAGRKLTPKEQRIIEHGGKNAQAVISRLSASKLKTLVQRIIGNDSHARAVKARADAAKMKQLTQFIERMLSNPGFTGPPPPTVYQNIVRRLGGLVHATGTDGVRGQAATPGTARAQDRAIDRVQRGQAARSTTTQAQRGMKVSGPRAIWGEEPQHPEFVIATNPSYRKSNLRYLRQAAGALGVEMAATGKGKKKDPSITPKHAARARKYARANLKSHTKPRHYASDNLKELATVETRKREEDNFRDRIQREANQLDAREPDSFLKVVSTDPYTGEQTFAVDEQAMWSWNDQLTKMAMRFDQLTEKIKSTLEAVRAAMTRIGNPYGDAKDGSVIGRANKNIDTIQAMIARDQSVANNAKTKAGRQAAEERLGVYKAALTREKETKDNATSDWKQMDAERNDIGGPLRGRMSEAMDTASGYYGDAAALQGKATADMTASNPQAALPEKPADPPTALETALGVIDALDTESALASIGQGTRTSDQVRDALLGAHQNVIDQGMRDLSDSDPNNDSAARSAIQSSSGAIANIRESIANAATTGAGDTSGSGGAGDTGGTDASTAAAAASAINEFAVLSTARSDLFRAMGSNFAMAAGFGATAGAFGGAFGPSLGGGQPMAGGGITNVFNQNFQQTPDPHTWSQGVAFELQAAL